jgi:hypothetical protein
MTRAGPRGILAPAADPAGSWPDAAPYLQHPVYARQAWVSILNPGPQASDQACTLITEAYDRAAARYRPHR